MNEGTGESSAEAMERMMRTRGQAVGSRESELEAGTAEQDYATALSQIPSGENVAPAGGVVPRGDASPGTLEQGGVTMPVASPFHSERVQAEVELLRRRPPTLDQDAQRVGGSGEDAGLGEDFSGVKAKEPPYDREPISAVAPIRVARLEQSSEAVPGTTGGIVAEPPLETLAVREPLLNSGPDATNRMSAGLPPTPLGDTTIAGDALSERSRLSVAGSGTRPTESALGRSGGK